MLLRSLLAAQRSWPSSLHQLELWRCIGSLQGRYTAAAAKHDSPRARSSTAGTWWAAAGAATMAAAAASAPVLADKTSTPPATSAGMADDADGVVADGGKLLPLSMRQRIFFKYEKRIRDLSSLEKIYDYFATHEHGSTKVMTSQDVVRALVPTYPPVGSKVERAGFLNGEPPAVLVQLAWQAADVNTARRSSAE
eukprot:GHRQ01023283.1.p1 GENE.GHRQ01023283.1~~GHRQ01023283.1.p1  ORF type:complete len:195 (+),score=66.48 GHRQ01023283.1:267-851(+)